MERKLGEIRVFYGLDVFTQQKGLLSYANTINSKGLNMLSKSFIIYREPKTNPGGILQSILSILHLNELMKYEQSIQEWTN